MQHERRLILALLAAAGWGSGALAGGSSARAHGSPPPVVWPDSSGYARSERAYQVPDLVLTDSEERPVRLRALLDAAGPVMVNFIFTTCSTICPVMVKVFADLPGQLGAEAGRLRLVSISIDPEHDTPARLRTYAREHSAGAQWRFLTGRLQDITAVQRAFASYRGDKMNHEPVTLLHATPGNTWVRIDGFASASELAGEYRRAILK